MIGIIFKTIKRKLAIGHYKKTPNHTEPTPKLIAHFSAFYRTG
jgi:hypothetical protein